MGLGIADELPQIRDSGAPSGVGVSFLTVLGWVGISSKTAWKPALPYCGVARNHSAVGKNSWLTTLEGAVWLQ
jgi:hypothetical protein